MSSICQKSIQKSIRLSTGIKKAFCTHSKASEMSEDTAPNADTQTHATPVEENEGAPVDLYDFRGTHLYEGLSFPPQNLKSGGLNLDFINKYDK